MSLLDLAEFKERPAKRSRKSKVLEKLEELLAESLSIRELITALELQPGVSSVDYEKGTVRFLIDGLPFTVRFDLGSVLELEFPFVAIPPEEEWPEIIQEVEKLSGVSRVLRRPSGLVIEFDEMQYTPDLAAGVLTRAAGLVVAKLQAAEQA